MLKCLIDNLCIVWQSTTEYILMRLKKHCVYSFSSSSSVQRMEMECQHQICSRKILVELCGSMLNIVVRALILPSGSSYYFISSCKTICLNLLLIDQRLLKLTWRIPKITWLYTLSFLYLNHFWSKLDHSGRIHKLNIIYVIIVCPINGGSFAF